MDYATAIHVSPFDKVFIELYLVPILLGAFWFGRKGGLAASLTATVPLLPCAFMAAPEGSAHHLGNLVELILYNTVGFVSGTMRDRERKLEKEKLEAVLAMAGCVGYELNNPLSIAMQSAQLLKELQELDSEQDWGFCRVGRHNHKMAMNPVSYGGS